MNKYGLKKDSISEFYLKILFIFLLLLILLYLFAPIIPCNIQWAKETEAEADIEILSTSLKLFRLDIGRYPSSKEGLNAIIFCPDYIDKKNWQGPYYYGKKLPIDPWGNDYNYIPDVSNDRALLYSYGKNGVSNSEGNDSDDINNWDETCKWEKIYHKDNRDNIFFGLIFAVILNGYLLWKMKKSYRDRE